MLLTASSSCILAAKPAAWHVLGRARRAGSGRTGVTTDLYRQLASLAGYARDLKRMEESYATQEVRVNKVIIIFGAFGRFFA